MEINRKRNGSLDSVSYTFGVTYTRRDVRDWLRQLFTLLSTGVDIDTVESCNISTQWTVSEPEVRHFFENTVFSHYPQKYRGGMSAWAFRQAVNHNFVKQSAVDDSAYILDDSIMD